jgi:alpha-glucuronidase
MNSGAVLPASLGRPRRPLLPSTATAPSSPVRRHLPMIATLGLPLDTLGTDGYLIRSVQVNGHRATVIAANDLGVLYEEKTRFGL